MTLRRAVSQRSQALRAVKLERRLGCWRGGPSETRFPVDRREGMNGTCPLAMQASTEVLILPGKLSLQAAAPRTRRRFQTSTFMIRAR